ncbi:tRNA threonylcarbamoyl adenosine modification protein YjeE [Bartonella bacilliformis str. Heidi Mejia]|uniref:tRNA threonylcarbamoyladenosine biosynthesis protein TsaE n=2 Tax=Bartonella bacilliformis TaxID=774 RepID=A1UUE9_BARBK|nr:bifunctional tRNA (adenosine(37)-N6)-threonylcarbamoyltransferase complex ATPase subunit type 1 TsaE/phosphotransferase [Bartonella bacilliformis]ABM45466.1 P-loop hydrolase/phosphotransferase [Bartonella bacilliformis KC583]AMG85221.1 bifunctional tRNA (adenosine(37)-N6)-threonylcarbamoyltransferase complex ATPase subunit type 1 TsaE/phosphotransferase [Bartonella bacilliformis]EKS42916.1 P-loop hydrolase/phosphotransferase [Bartonella bacilliformis INS]EYS88881.1 tRNA threonylcarbamoyl ade
MNFSFFLANEEATKLFAQDLALALKPGDLVTLQGDLGAGKSTLARAIIHTLANDDNLEVPSPTFTLVQNYKLPQFEVIHADLYRLSMAEEIDELGLHEAREQSILLIEWPEKGADSLGPTTFAISLQHQDCGRHITITAATHDIERLQQSLAIRTFLTTHGRGHVHRRFLASDASARSYELLHSDHHQEIFMNASIMQMAQKTDPAFAEKMHLATDIRQFVGINQIILENGFSAPHIFVEDLEKGFLILEDLGREGILDQTGNPIEERYIACSELLATFHQKSWVFKKQFATFSLQIPCYDHQSMQAELALLLDWYIPFQQQKTLNEEQRKAFFTCWQPYLDMLIEGENTLVMRDYHSPNILWRANKEGVARIGLIDFQDGLKGPTAYDLVSLAQDARLYISPELEMKIFNAYCHARHKAPQPFDENELRKLYALAGAQRVSKILGIFVQLHQQYGKSSYLKHLPHMQDYLARNLSHPILAPLKSFYQEIGILVETT